MSANSTGNKTQVSGEEIWKAEDQTDWERVRAMTDEEIEAAIADDPDAIDTDEEFWEDAVDCPPLTFVE
ncbi:MAG: hypothetical protein GVY04_13835 [Cyanobacteria bacterium]|nr:hypothetical protein [Cyanobacteria bacterium GSL.Bin1]